MRDFVNKIANFIRDIPGTTRAIITGICALIILLSFIPFVKKSYGKDKISLKISSIIVLALCIGIIVLLYTLK